MTILEMFDKVNEYNRIQDLLKLDYAEHIDLFFVDDATCTKVDSYEACERIIREMYVPECAELILNCDFYEFRRQITFSTYVPAPYAHEQAQIFTVEFQAA